MVLWQVERTMVSLESSSLQKAVCIIEDDDRIASTETEGVYLFHVSHLD